MDGFPGQDLTVFRAILPKLDTVMLSSPKSRRNCPSPPTPRSEASASSPSSSRPVNGTMIISPSHEFDHADALSLVKSARAAGLRLPENANYIFLPPSATPAEATSETPETSEDPNEILPSLSSVESSPARLRERKRAHTSTKKVVTTPLSSPATQNDSVTAKMTRKKRANPKEDSSSSVTEQDASRESPEFQIEKILKKRVTHGSRVRYLIKWVGSDELTWEPRSNFASDNDAWLAFKEEQAAKRTSAARTGKAAKSVSREKEFSKEASVDIVTPELKTLEKNIASQTLPESATSKSTSTTKTATAKKSNLEISANFAGPSSDSSPKLPVNKTLSNPNAVEKSFDQLNQLLAVPPVTSVVPKVPATSTGATTLSSVGTSPVRSIAPQPKAGQNFVQLTQVKHGDMYVYVPHQFAMSSASASSTSVTEATTTSPAASSSATPTVTIHLPSLESRKPVPSPEIQLPKSGSSVVPRLSISGAAFSGSSLNGAAPSRVGITASSTSYSASLNGIGQVQSVSSFSPRMVQIPTTRSPSIPVSTSMYNGLPGWQSSPSQSRIIRPVAPPMITVSPGSVLLGAPRAQPTKVISPRIVSVPIRAKLTREVGVNTALSFLSVKDVTTHAGIGKSGLDLGALVVNISGFKPRDVAITCLDDIAFLVTYANRDSEFVDYQECIRKIPHEVAEFLFKNKINAVDSPPLRIVA